LIESERQEDSAAGRGTGLRAADRMLALLCNGLGRYQDAVAAAWDPLDNGPDELFVSAWMAMELLEAATRSGNPELAGIALERIVAATAFTSGDSAVGINARSRALVSAGDTADSLYQEAIERLGRTWLRPELARTHLLYGEWLRRENRRVDAREQLRAGYDQFTSIGMEAFAERARRELLATGEIVRARTVETRDDLTAQERQIAELACDGLSNPEIAARLFLSPRTVEWHLRKVFGKLDIHRRRELADALSEYDSNTRPV
jgi:DNA-binding CsgD family transcriptional regulator